MREVRRPRLDRRLRGAAAAAALAAAALASCGGDDGGTSSGIPEPRPEWETDFEQSYVEDFSDDPVIDTSGRYTSALVETLDECGAGAGELEQLKDSVLAASPTSLGAPEQFSFVTVGGEPVFKFELTNAAANLYEVTSCEGGQ